MTTEATEIETETKTTKRNRTPRGGNTLVDKVADSLEPSVPAETSAPTASPEEEAVAAARRNLGPVVTPEKTPDANYNPFTRPEATPPKMPASQAREEGLAERLKANQPTPSTKRLGSLGKKLPGAERAKVHKRVEGGNLAYIGEYNDGDLSQSQDIESFLHRYIKPVYGPGEYQITGVDAHGREFDMGIVNLLAPVSPNLTPEIQQQQETPLSLVRELVQRSLNQPQPAQKDPIEMLGRLHELKTQMEPPPPPKPEKDNALLLAIVGGLTTVASSLVTVLAQPKAPDPIMQLLMAKLLDEKPRGEPMPLPPPPPPAADPTEQLKNLAAVVQSLRGDTPTAKDDRLIEILMKDRMAPADVLTLVNQAKGERGTDDFKKSMENLGIMLTAVNQLRQHTETGSGAGIWDAIGALAGNKELAGTIVSAIRSRKGEPEPQEPQRQQLAAPDPLVVKAREVAARKLALEEQELNRREAAVIATPPPARIAPPTSAPAPSPTPAPAQAQPEPKTLGKIPPLPPEVPDYINRYIEAKDDAEMVGITIDLLFTLGENDAWKSYSDVLFSFVTQGDKARFIQHMSALFVTLQSINMIEGVLVQKIVAALGSNFDAIVEGVHQQMEANAAEGSDEDEGEAEEDEPLLGEGEPVIDTDVG